MTKPLKPLSLSQLLPQALPSRHPPAPPTLPAKVQQILSVAASGMPPPAGDRPGATTSLQFAFALDASASMWHHRAAAIAGFNEQLSALQHCEHPIRVAVSLDLYSEAPHLLMRRVPLDAVTPLTPAAYLPSGNRALYDSVGGLIESLLPSSGAGLGNEIVSLQIVADGPDDCSRRYDAATLAALMRRLEASGLWRFTLVAAETCGDTLAEALGLSSDSVTLYGADDAFPMATRLAQCAAANVAYADSCAQGGPALRPVLGQPDH